MTFISLNKFAQADCPEDKIQRSCRDQTFRFFVKLIFLVPGSLERNSNSDQIRSDDPEFAYYTLYTVIAFSDHFVNLVP